MIQATLFLTLASVSTVFAGWGNPAASYDMHARHKRFHLQRRAGPSGTPKPPAPGDGCNLGLKPSSSVLYKNNIAVGFLPNFETPGSVNNINSALNEPIALIGDYVQIYQNESTVPQPLVQTYYHINNVTAANPAQQPVYVIALQPQDGFGNVTAAVINAIQARMYQLNQMGITVWLRYAYEMNLGPGFSPYSGMPTQFINSWRALSTAIKANATTAAMTCMLWSPNVDTNSPPNYSTYYPGNGYVDIAGLSLYSFAEQNRTANDALAGSEFSTAFSPFYSQYSYLPITISETSKPYNYPNQTDYPNTPEPGTAQGMEAQTKTAWFQQLTTLPSTSGFTSLIAVNWFEFNKTEQITATNGATSTVFADFRALTGMAAVRQSVANYLNSA